MDVTPDILMRTRLTILDLLERRGYDVSPYRAIDFKVLERLLKNGSANGLRIEVQDTKDQNRKACVLFLLSPIKKDLTNQKFLLHLQTPGDDTDNPYISIVDSEENIRFQDVLVNYLASEFYEENDTFDKAALSAYTKTNKVVNVQFFPYGTLVSNPLAHELQPKFEIVPKDDHEALLKSLYAKKVTQLPMIKFHADMAGRCLGLRPGDIVKITAPSRTAGEYVKYRVCVP